MTLLAIFEALVGANAIWETTVQGVSSYIIKHEPLRLQVTHLMVKGTVQVN